MRPLSIGIACFPSVGGSGVVASELGVGLAARGHRVHVFSSGLPGRLRQGAHGCHLHRVDPVLRAPLEHGAYELSLASAMVAVAEGEGLDVLHVHYAIPHATSALLARQILQRRGRPAPPLITSLHGTDVTAFGGEPLLGPVVRHAALESDLLTVPSEWLRRLACERLGLGPEQRVLVVPNFVDPEEFRPDHHLAPPEGLDLQAAFPQHDWSGPRRPSVLLHASNFRPLKRVGDAVVALSEMLRTRPCVLLLAGDGPERDGVERLTRVLDVDDHVLFLGEQQQLSPVMALSDLFLLPSETESFGLAALEALSCGVPVVASEVGGLPEVVRQGETGLLVPRHDPRAMAAAALSLLADQPRRAAMGKAARADVLARFRPEPVLLRYEQLYRELLEK